MFAVHPGALDNLSQFAMRDSLVEKTAGQQQYHSLFSSSRRFFLYGRLRSVSTGYSTALRRASVTHRGAPADTMTI